MTQFVAGLRHGILKLSADLTTRGRRQIKAKNFALSGERYPIHDARHARNALARVAQHGSPAEQATVRAKVHAKYPGIGKEAFIDPVGIAATRALSMGANLAEYALMMKSERFRGLANRIGNDLMRTGFKHALLGKRVPRTSLPAITSAVGFGSAPMVVYEQGWEVGNRMSRAIEKIPGVRGMHPLQAARGIDTAVQSAIKTAPVTGALAGAGANLVQEKAQHPRRELTAREIGTAAALGGVGGALAGAGVRKLGPHIPVAKQLHSVRTEYLDRLVKGTNSGIERVLDRFAKPIAKRPREL